MTKTPIFQVGFSDDLRESAARLYDEAFGSKLSHAIKDPDSRIAILSAGFNPNCSLVAIVDEEVVGIAGFNDGTRSLTGGITFQILKEQLGYPGAIWATLVSSIFHRKPRKKQLLMDGLSVAATMRGKGIGTILLSRLKDWARKEGAESIRLDVIDTNPAAKRLHERMGFQEVRVERYEWLRTWLGFGAVTEMEYRLDC